jgi:hypothetical protein
MYNTDTKNKSFLEMSKFLKMSGIKNNLFMLKQLSEEKLPDPYDPFLTDSDKARIIHESMNNIWYYFREVVRIPNGNVLEKFELTPATMAVIYALNSGYNIYWLGCRQVSHKTTTMLLYLLWGRQLRAFFINANNLNHFNIRLAELHNTLPSYIRNHGFPGLILNPGNEKDLYWYDDAEHMEYTDANVDPSNTEDHIVITSTVGKEYNAALETIRRKADKFDIEMYDKHLAKSNWVYMNFHADDLGMSEGWKLNALKAMNNNQEEYDREIMLKRWE